MKRNIIMILAMLCLALQPMSAQKKTEGTENYKFYKACEIMDNGGDPKEARRLVNENIKENPQHIRSYLLLISLDRMDKDYASALGNVDKAMKNNHRNSDISDANLLWWRGSIFNDMGDYNAAAETMEQAVKVARKHDKANLHSMMEDLAQYRYELKEYDVADAIYWELLKMDDSSLLPRIGLARNEIERHNYDSALEILNKCKQYDKDYDEVYRFEMMAYEGKKEYKKMIDAMITLLDKTKDANYLEMNKFKKDKKYAAAVLKEKIAAESDNVAWKFILAMFYQDCHMYSKAVTILDGLINEYGYDADLLETRSDCYKEMGMTESAIGDMNKCISMSIGDKAVYYHSVRGDIHRYSGNYEEAVKDYTVMVDRFPTKAYGYYARGWSRELYGDYKGAMDDYNEGIAVDDDFPYIYLMRGVMYQKSGNQELAEKDFKMVIQKDTVVMDGSCRHFALYFLDKEVEALEWMERIIADDSDNPGHYYDKACLLSRMGKCDEAVAALSTAFEKGYRRFALVASDDDIAPIRNRDDFRSLIAKYEQIHREEVKAMTRSGESESATVVSEVEMKKMYGGTYEVPCSVNGLPLKMIFDTGASDVTISSVEASFMLKNGYLSGSDVKGKTHYMTASGDIHEGTVLKLREVRLGEAVLKNVEASVVHSQKAPLLLGQSILEKFGTITLDNVNSKLLIKQ